MSDDRIRPPDRSGHDGFDRVLDGEKDADARLSEGRGHADEIRRRAAAEEHRIALRADRRLRALHSALQAQIEAEKRRLVEAFETDRQEHSAVPEKSQIDAAAMRLARRLVGLDKP